MSFNQKGLNMICVTEPNEMKHGIPVDYMNERYSRSNG